ncbi:MAG: PorT family protein [Bacteroidetes bacterium]|nr:MAG: PorT family protein [Bacteroidota bacterium]
MSRIFFVLTLVIVLFCQALYGQRFQGGLRGGLVASEVSGDNLGGPNKLGWFSSAFTFVGITDYSDLMLEIMYIQKGSRSIPNERNQFYEYKFYMQYVEVPVHYRMDIARYTDLAFLEQLKVNAGLSVSVLVDHLETDMGTPVPSDEREDFHPAELNLLLGLSFPLSNSIDFNFGFSNSLTPIRPHAGGGKVWYNRGQYNTLWTFGISYVFW